MARGLFITFEGGEGTGKSTQISRLDRHLRSEARLVLRTREPGGSPEAETIRRELTTGETGRWSPLAETLLVNAARDAHLRSVIRPALARGRDVLCDRFMDSTRAYQGHAGGADMALIDLLERQVVGDTRPDLTLVFDLDPAQGLARAGTRLEPSADRFERKGLAFHRKLRDGFLAIARAEPERCVVVNAAMDEDQVFTAVLAATERLLSRKP